MAIQQVEFLSRDFLHAQTTTDDAVWFAIQTRARSEKKVNAQLQIKGIETFLPLLREFHRWSDRQQLVHQPLFPGYVFVHIDQCPELRLSILNTYGVCGFVGIHGVGVPIPEKQILDLQIVVANPLPMSPYPFFRAGQRVRVRGGCLDGVEGTLVSTNSDQSVVVSIELVRRSVAVRIDGYDFELI